MPSTTAAQLARLIQSLHHERQQHASAIMEIDGVFDALGITGTPAVKRGRKPGALRAATAPPAAPVAAPVEAKASGKKRRRRSKSKDGMTGEQFLLALLGNSKLSTADVNAKWKESGRKGTANNLLGLLVKDGKLKRAEATGMRGSVYSAV